ncbi:hypothetical protein GXP70_12405 [Paenibacillus lycopersici]|uniref:Terminase n=1 Tax=Paenibacillus lycopersici TaxID=2704462 RepID=A0A6C0FX88_9BACL|nr:hypothetical protein [Paenibacillus lycopersici]QHT60662.1 hypothetical protein GXP70_12405 [Paenibacillus lycopersici]
MLLANIHNRIKEQAKVKQTVRWVREPKSYIQERLFIRNKTKQVVPLLFNPIQALYWMEKTKRDIILKPRQLGFSTLTVARFFECVINEENVTAAIVAHDSDSTQKIFQIVQLMYERLPEAKKEQLNNGKNKPKYGNRKEFFFAGNNSRIYVGTAGADKFGRGQTINYLLCSEVAFWPNPEELMTGLLEAVPIDGEIVIESTANGVGNYYHQTYEGAKKGDNTWTPHFYAWFQHPDYQLPLNEGEMLEYTADERELVEKYKLTPEQVKWRRWKIASMPSSADMSAEERFAQEYPANDMEAFLMTGTPVFDAKKVMARIELLQERYKQRAEHGDPVVRGNFVYTYTGQMIVDSSIRFLPDPNGIVTIYVAPEPRRPYVIGGDTAEGGKDYSAGQVLDNITGEQVAVWHGHSDTDLYAKQMYCLGKYYNIALTAIEVNFDLHPVKELDRLGYHRQYWREQLDDINESEQPKYGFRTTKVTRPVIIAELVTVVRESIQLINDIATLQEMLSFVRNDNGRPEALPGKHDDLIMALAIAHQARGQQSMVLEPEEYEDVDYEVAFGSTGY